MSAAIPLPQGDQWKDPRYVEAWRNSHKKKIEQKWAERLRYEPFLLNPKQQAREATQGEYESLGKRAERLEPGAKKKARSADQARHQVPAMIAYDREWIIHPAVRWASNDKLTKSQSMYRNGLEKKAQREIACGLLGGEIECRSGHKFSSAYRCGNRYCTTCAPIDGKKLFARQADRLLFVATRLMLCGVDECAECSKAIEEKRLPHWPPPPKPARPRIVCAKLDFTLKHNPADGMPAPERMRELNSMIKKFCRAIERRFRISRKEYGLAYCDELGGNNSNPHAHGIYVGPWLPQSKEQKELSNLWREITGGESFILSIKFARNFSEALFHAIKYPAKFATRSSPKRLAELETVFHRVRRFHTLAAFYAPEAPEKEKPQVKRCPICDDFLTEPRGWVELRTLAARGLREIEGVRAELKKSEALGDRSPP
jgi:hypothetical protein